MEKLFKEILFRCGMTLAVLATFGITWLISQRYFLSVYLPLWTSENSYWYVWVIAAVLSLCGQYIVSGMIAAGNIAGIVTGQILGDCLRELNMAKITPDMKPEQVYQLSSHEGVFIWLCTIFIFAVIGVIISIIVSKRRQTSLE